MKRRMILWSAVGVVNPGVVTTTGISASMPMSLTLIEVWPLVSTS